MKKVTIDTDCLPAEELLIKSRGYSIEITSVTEREVRSSRKQLLTKGICKILETTWLNESEIGNCFLAEKGDHAEEILQIISNGSFPQSDTRESLSNGQLHQLRDALILEAHSREKRDIFVTNDKKGFIDNKRREKLEALLGTRILTKAEFLDELRSETH